MLKQARLNVILALIALFGALLFVTLALFGNVLSVKIIGESSPFENATAAAYLLGALLALYTLTKRRAAKYTLVTLLWAALCVVFFGEETSWLQHLIGYSTPASIAEKNLQGEFNFHNLEGFMTTAGAGSFHESVSGGAFNWRGLLSGQNLFRLGFLSYFVMLPLAIYALIFVCKLDRRRVVAAFPLPSLAFVVTVCFVIGVSVVAYFVSPDMRKEISEVRETFYALFIFLYVLTSLFQPTRRADQVRATQPEYATSTTYPGLN